MMTRSLTKLDAAGWLMAHDGFAIVTHRRPDGDTLGSAAALCRGLRQLGKTAHVLENPEVTPRYAPLLAGLTKEAPEEQDLLVAVDVAAAKLLPMGFDGQIHLRIDHHGNGTPFADLELVDGEAAACGEVILELLEMLWVSLDKPMAEALYTAVATDTGCFRYANTTAHSFQTAGACAAAGGDLYSVNQALFETNSLAKLRIQGWIAENTCFLDEGRIAVCPLPKAVEEAIGVTEDDMDGISGFPRSIEGVKMSALLRETADGKVKASLRAVPGYDVSAVCAKFGGGGHKGAAGCTLSLPLEEAAKAIADAMM